MSKVKKIFLMIWGINIITLVGLFIYGRVSNSNFLSLTEFRYIKIVLIIYMIYDYFKFNLGTCNVDSQILYVLCVFVCIIFIIAGFTFIIKLDYYRISEFSFFVFLSFTFRMLSISIKVPNFLLLKAK